MWKRKQATQLKHIRHILHCPKSSLKSTSINCIFEEYIELTKIISNKLFLAAIATLYLGACISVAINVH